MNSTQPLVRSRNVRAWLLVTTVLAELITLYLRFGLNATAVEFNRTAPLVLQVHHMFWSIPLMLVATFFWRKNRVRGALLGPAGGLVVSDLLHHFLVLPLTVGNTGWHWP